MIIKTSVEIDTNSSFSNPETFEVSGIADHIDITGLSAETSYYVRAYVVDDQGNRIDGENTMTFTTTAAGPNYFYIQNMSNNSNMISLTKIGTPTTGTTLEYLLYESIGWVRCNYDSNNICHIELAPMGSMADKVYFRSSDGFSTSSNYYNFSGTQNFIVGGDLTTLLDHENNTIDTIPNNGAFMGMFKNSTITDASLLDCSKIVHSSGNNDFNTMFDGCAELLYACNFPNLTDATYNIFGECFKNCTSLIKGSIITNIISSTNWGLQNMYQNCYSLREVWAPNLSSWPTFSSGFMSNAGRDVTSGTKVIYIPTGAFTPPYPSQTYPWTIEYI